MFRPGAPAVTPEAREDRRTAARREIVDAVWRTVRDRHYDPKLGGVDWVAVRARYEPLALGAPDDAAFYRLLNQMVGELGQSHMSVTGPGAEEASTSDEDSNAAADGGPARPSTTQGVAAPGAGPALGAPVTVEGIGDPGLVVRSIEGRAVVTSVAPRSSAERRGIRPGFIVLRIGGRALDETVEGGLRSRRPLRPVEERFALRRLATHRLQGAVGTRVTLEYLDNDDRPGKTVLTRDAHAGPIRQIGHLPPLYPEARVRVIDGIGVVSLNLFLLDPILGEFQRAIDKFRALHVRGVIVDLRGNPGGIGAMAIPIASELVSRPTALGTIHFRTFTQTFTAQPAMGRTPFTGPLVILTDEGSASTSEILAGGLKEAGRARVGGETTLGAVLPSVIEALPGGAIMQVVVADFQTPKGILLEGRGVEPNQFVSETRAAFRAGDDPILSAGLEDIRAKITQNHEPAASSTSAPARARVARISLRPPSGASHFGRAVRPVLASLPVTALGCTLALVPVVAAASAGCDGDPEDASTSIVDGGTGGGFGAGDLYDSFVVLPDTQFYASDFPEIFAAQTRWVVENRAAQRIAFVLHTGDIVDADTPQQWDRASGSLRLLDGEVPYVITAGNHDYLTLADRMGMGSAYFPPSGFESYPWFGGTFEPEHIENSFSLFDLGATQWVVIALEFGPRDEVVAWADGLLKRFADRRAIIITHAYLYRDGTRYDHANASAQQSFNPHDYVMADQPGTTINDGEELWQKLILPNPGVKLVFSGHDVNGRGVPPGTAAQLTSVRPDGTRVHQILANYQTCLAAPCASFDDGARTTAVHGGNGFLRILRLAKDGRSLAVSTYSPYLDASLTDRSNQFALGLD